MPASISWEDSKAQSAIIRWIALPGNDDIDDPGDDSLEEEVFAEDYDQFEALSIDGIEDDERFKPYAETTEGKAEVVVQSIIGEWLRRRCGIEDGLVFCAECYKFMRLRSGNCGKKSWGTKMLTRDL